MIITTTFLSPLEYNPFFIIHFYPIHLVNKNGTHDQQRAFTSLSGKIRQGPNVKNFGALIFTFLTLSREWNLAPK